ncbi:hypothetical protein H109_05550 [Trichophyton interdigitale MR816]|uniref:Uncharacterized protein n=1 Tax=Trichophyton interdigitale (strain MR816) TaxID=1215338 RepID=A0A059J3Q8_TRIIM|nr:hypothetical protein H101_03893 [Trichophyton interdigitale H6]KDB22516.1 hypothetical protein H109_05550 [Trichophyton interdigitale MR816]
MNIFGLNGHALPDNPDIGWACIDIPEYSKPYLNSLSALGDAARRLAKSIPHITSHALGSIIYTIGSSADLGQPMSDIALPYVEVSRKFKDQIASLNIGTTEEGPTWRLRYCDRIRNVDHFDLSIYRENQDSGCAIIRLVTSDLIKARQGQTK